MGKRTSLTLTQWELKDGTCCIRLVLLVTLRLQITSLTKSKSHSLTLPRRVNPNILGKDNWSPLEIAVQSGFFQIVDILLKDKRTKINEINKIDRGSALHLAAKSNYLPIVQILLLSGIDLTLKDSSGKLAKELTNQEPIRFLIEKYEKLEKRMSNQQLIEEIKEEEFENDEEEGSMEVRNQYLEEEKASQSLYEQVENVD